MFSPLSHWVMLKAYRLNLIWHHCHASSFNYKMEYSHIRTWSHTSNSRELNGCAQDYEVVDVVVLNNPVYTDPKSYLFELCCLSQADLFQQNFKCTPADHKKQIQYLSSSLEYSKQNKLILCRMQIKMSVSLIKGSKTKWIISKWKHFRVSRSYRFPPKIGAKTTVCLLF